jgi:hypothetical protein
MYICICAIDGLKEEQTAGLYVQLDMPASLTGRVTSIGDIRQSSHLLLLLLLLYKEMRLDHQASPLVVAETAAIRSF